MGLVYIGLDISKGYSDLVPLDAAGTRLPGAGRYDDTAQGHQAVKLALDVIRKSQPEVRFVIGVEATGGLERNWLRGFRSWAHEGDRIHKINPLVVKRYLQQDLHRTVTDASSALGIAEYLASGRAPRESTPADPDEGARTLYRHLCNLIGTMIRFKNELQALLSSANPELVRYASQGIPQWLRRVLLRYPTAERLGRARTTTLAQIPYLTAERAERIVEAARSSVASLCDPATEATIRSLIRWLGELDEEINRGKAALIARMEGDVEVRRLTTIPGIGAWTAVLLRLEYGSFKRFHSAAAVVAFAGLDPVLRQSGDSERRYAISHRGRSSIRAGLYMAARTAVRCNPAVGELYARIRQKTNRDDVAITACMAKLLKIAYACVVSEKDYDPDYHRKCKERHEAAPGPDVQPLSDAGSGTATPATGSVDAPISHRERRRRIQKPTWSRVNSSPSIASESGRATPQGVDTGEPGAVSEGEVASPPQAGKPRKVRGRVATSGQHAIRT